MLQEYIIQGQTDKRSIRVGYNEEGDLISIVLDGELNADQRRYALRNLPVGVNYIFDVAKKFGWKVTPVAFNLSFDHFYEVYGNKVGKKQAQKVWDRLSKDNKIKALMYIKTYDQNLKLTPGVQKKYPATYLNSEPWND